MENDSANRVEEQVRSAFPEGAVNRVQLLTYGDDPRIEPGQTAVRVFISDKEIVRAFEKASREVRERLCNELPSIGWIDFRTDTKDRPARSAGPLETRSFRFKGSGRVTSPDELSEQLTPVMTRLGAADLATVDTLITAGIANSRADVLRWAVGRIRENPAYAQIQDQVHEIGELKTKF